MSGGRSLINDIDVRLPVTNVHTVLLDIIHGIRDRGIVRNGRVSGAMAIVSNDNIVRVEGNGINDIDITKV